MAFIGMSLSFTVKFSTVVALLTVSVGAQSAPTVTLTGSTTTTTITGVYVPFEESEYLNVDTTLEAFLGIPYAEPPVGDLRFRRTTKKEDMGESYLANSSRATCHQKSFTASGMDEDCLYLGVHTSSPRPTSAPVMVWFHGGSYMAGGGSWPVYEPLSLLALAPDMVVVTVNYRLGVIGFLTTGTDASPGNYGMYDQVLALEWVQENIGAFGGDPTRVTIMGQSAGGGSVGLHVLSPLSKDLFSQAVMQSGTALCPWAVDTNMERQLDFTTQLAELVNCTPSLDEAMMDCLRTKEARDLVRAQSTLVVQNLLNELLFVPVVDGNFIPDIPIEIIRRKEFNSVPTLIGINEDEGTLIALRVYPTYVVKKTAPNMTLEKFRAELPKYMYFKTPALVPAVEQWYIDWSLADDPDADQLKAFIDLNTDQVYACATEVTARSLVETGSPVYRYEMTHDPSWSVWAGIPGWLGAGHAEELQYVFGWDLNPKLMNFCKQTDEEKYMSVQFMRYWTNFIRTGDPNLPLSTGEYPEWPRYTLPDQEEKILSVTMENDRALRAGSCAFWLKYGPEVYKHSEPDYYYNDWKKQYGEWKDVHMPDWTQVFDDFKEENYCSDP